MLIVATIIAGMLCLIKLIKRIDSYRSMEAGITRMDEEAFHTTNDEAI